MVKYACWNPFEVWNLGNSVNVILSIYTGTLQLEYWISCFLYTMWLCRTAPRNLLLSPLTLWMVWRVPFPLHQSFRDEGMHASSNHCELLSWCQFQWYVVLEWWKSFIQHRIEQGSANYSQPPIFERVEQGSANYSQPPIFERLTSCFYIFYVLHFLIVKKIRIRVIFNNVKILWNSNFGVKVSLEAKDTHSFTFLVWLLLFYNSVLESLPQRPSGPQSQKELPSCLPFTEKFADPSIVQDMMERK